eukprot:PhM_4_TR13855/c0_g1_i1/m.26385/K01265/map; methionyl aminopeptidase
MSASVSCEGCGAAEAPMVCPTCKQLGLTPSYFCKQDCFKASWKTHKAKHKNEKPAATISTMSDQALHMYNFTGSLRPAKITPKRSVPKHIARPDYADHPQGKSKIEESDIRQRIVAHSPEVIEKMREVCRLSREVLDLAAAAVKPGITTDAIDEIVHNATVERNMYPSPLNYYNFPKSLCTSVNEVICHGIPDARALEDGDIVNLDISCYLNGFHADLNETVFVGTPSAESIHLVHTAWECLQCSIKMCKPGTFYRSLGDAITERAEKGRCSVVRSYCGHGVCDQFHSAPNVPHYANNKAVGTMEVGNIFTIEPMINAGVWQDVTWPDQWTSTTMDGKRSAQFEETLLITPDGVDILTKGPLGMPWYQKQLKDLGIPLPVMTSEQ